MVLSAIKKKLGKGSEEPKEAPAPAEDSEEIPDELPPLMEEDEKETPEELPALEENIEEAQPPAEESGTPEEELAKAVDAKEKAEKEAPAEEAPKEAKDTKEAPKVEEKSVAEIDAEIQKTEEHLEKLSQESKQELTPPSPSGFFGTLKGVVSDTPNLREELLDQDLLSRMKAFWSAKHAQDEVSWDNEDMLNRQLEQKMQTLQALESKWHIQAMALEHERKMLQEREEEIRKKGSELQALMRAMKFYKKVPDGKAFTLSNGLHVHSLKELFDTVSVIDDATLITHVHGKKNDFAKWADHVLGEPLLGEALRNAKTRGGMLKVLEATISMAPKETEPGAFHKHKVHRASPGKYFETTSGTVIKTLQDLPGALRDMSDEDFSHHMHHGKNDFAEWVQHVFHKHELSKRMHLAKSKQELINILEVYL